MAGDELLESILATVIDGVIVIDDAGVVTTFNPAAERIFGYAAAEVLGHNVRILMDEPIGSEHDAHMARYRASGRSKVVGGVREVLGRHKSGREIPLELALSEMTIDGRLMFTGITRDLTERKETERALVQAQKMEALGALAGGVAHDFNNLLTTIMSFGWFILDGLPEADPRRADATEIMNAAESGARLTGQLLAFSRNRAIEPVVMDLNDAIDAVDKMLRRALMENIELVVLPLAEELPILFDPGQFDQLVFNLAVNGRDAMGDGGTLTIETSRQRCEANGVLAEGEYAVMTVSDTGPGIPDPIASRIFEPFFSTKGEAGTGLGLSTCFGIVRQAGGDIVVDSSSGHGATFSIWIPLTDQEATRMLRSQPTGDARVRSGRILVVEDQPVILRMVIRALTEAGFATCEARTAEEATTLLAELHGRVDLLVTDIVLPGLSGVALCRRLRAANPTLPVLFMSGYASEEPDASIRATGSTEFLAKPFSAPQMLAKVDQLMDDATRSPLDGDILLVEDDHEDAELTRRLLERSGVAHEIVIRRNGEDALEYLLGDQGPVPTRLVLLDLGLPCISGLELLRRTRADDRTKALPIVVLTGSAADDDRVASEKHGATGFMRKPLTFDKLSSILRKIGLSWSESAR